MIPDLPNLSDPTLEGDFFAPYRRAKIPLIDYARGGVALLDASKGLNVKSWVCEANDDGVYISSSGIPPFKVETLIGAPSWLSFCFDQNMHYNLTYVIKGLGAFLYWYDTVESGYRTLSLGDVSTPILRMDDVRDYALGVNSIILSYIKNKALCVRVQDDRFGVEYVLADNAGDSLVQCGMNEKYRFQWYCA